MNPPLHPALCVPALLAATALILSFAFPAYPGTSPPQTQPSEATGNPSVPPKTTVADENPAPEPSQPHTPPAPMNTETLPRLTSSEPPAQHASPTLAVEAAATLAIRLLDALLPQLSATPNVSLSPYSLASALAMTYSGSSGLTRQQIAAALGFPADPARLAASFKALDQQLLTGANTGEISLHRANRLFGQTGWPFRPEFLALCREFFDAPLGEENFEQQPENARRHINAWVEQQTRHRIRDLLPQGSVQRDTRLVLVNALHFKAPWAEPFPEADTRQAPFHSLDGTARDVPTMRLTTHAGFQREDSATIVALPFRDLPAQFVIILPSGTPSPMPLWPAFLSPERILSLPQLPRARISLALPRFRIEPPTLELADVLSGMGMPSAFDRPRGSANFDALSPRRPDDYLHLSGVFHKTFLDVNEAGAEAAAATAVAMVRATFFDPEEPIPVTVDRPFWFLLQHIPTGTPLLLGRIASLP